MPFDDSLNDSYFTSYEKLNSLKELLNPDTKIDHKLIVEVFNDLYVYLDSIDINDNIYIITFLYNKLKKEKGNEQSFIININKLIFSNITTKYFFIIINYYNEKMQDSALKFFMHQYIQHFTYKIILLLYSYYFYIDKIISYEKQHHSKHFYPRYILIIVDPDIELIEDLIVRKSKLYSIIINNFKKDILKIEQIDKIQINIYDIIINYANINTETDNILLKIIYDLIKLLTIVYNNGIIQEYIHTTYANEYITIPQYTGNCWYISMLTCMCYSDASKRKILSKKKIELLVNANKKNNSDKTFLIIIFFILSITTNYKKYGDYNDEEKCNIFLFFKNNLMNYIYQRYNELNDPTKNSSKKRLGCQNDVSFKGTNDMYFKHLSSDIRVNKIILDDEEAKKISFGLKIIDSFYIINTFYNILDITTLYLVYNDDSNYFRQKDKNIYKLKETLSNPDIIFLDKRKQYLIEYDYFEQFSGITRIDTNTIEFNGKIYILDYILHNSDYDRCEKNCSHCICGIHYDGVEYCYDSQHSSINTRCRENDIIIPCTLIKQNWSHDIKKICLYSIQRCFRSEINTSSQEVYKDLHNEDRLCFSTENDIIYAYFNTGKTYEEWFEPSAPLASIHLPSSAFVEQSSPIDPNRLPMYVPSAPSAVIGGINTYKSTHKKVNIMNKNKTIIERTIYIDKNKNKFIKFNKNYEPLSNFKYNRKK